MIILFKAILQSNVLKIERLYEWAQRHPESEIKTVLDAMLALAED